jgi:hypothetical protein
MSLAQCMLLEATQFSRTGKATVKFWTHIFKIFHKANYPNVRTLCTATFLTIPDQRQRGVGTLFLICVRASDYEVFPANAFKTHSVHCAVYCGAPSGSPFHADFRNRKIIFGSLVSDHNLPLQQHQAAHSFLRS